MRIAASSARGNGRALPPIVHAANIGSSVARLAYVNGLGRLEWLGPKIELLGKTARQYQQARECFAKRLIAAGMPLADVGSVLAAIDTQAVWP